MALERRLIEYVGCHPCINTSSLRLRSADVFGKFLEHVHHGYQVVKIETVEE